MKTSEITTELFQALMAAKQEMGRAKADKFNAHLKSEYATLSALADVYTEPCAKQSLMVIHSVFSEGDCHFVETRICHKSGQWMATTMKLLLKSQDMQNLGSSITYAKRQQISSLLGILTEIDDEAIANSNKKVAQKALVHKQALSVAVDLSKQSREVENLATGEMQKITDTQWEQGRTASGKLSPSKLAYAMAAKTQNTSAPTQELGPLSIVDWKAIKEPGAEWPHWSHKIDFGKYTGKTIKEAGFSAIAGYLQWMEKEAHKKNENISLKPAQLRKMFAGLNL